MMKGLKLGYISFHFTDLIIHRSHVSSITYVCSIFNGEGDGGGGCSDVVFFNFTSGDSRAHKEGLRVYN